jgi:hypothetical protein
MTFTYRSTFYAKKDMKYPGEGEEGENIRYLINVQTSYRQSSKHFLNGNRIWLFRCFFSLTLSYSSKGFSQSTMLPIQSGVV